LFLLLIDFLQLSQAPPGLAIDMGNLIPEIIIPIEIQDIQVGTNKVPIIKETKISIAPEETFD
jgi:hypothetical protein